MQKRRGAVQDQMNAAMLFTRMIRKA
jgi:hypothetical protein